MWWLFVTCHILQIPKQKHQSSRSFSCATGEYMSFGLPFVVPYLASWSLARLYWWQSWRGPFHRRPEKTARTGKAEIKTLLKTTVSGFEETQTHTNTPMMVRCSLRWPCWRRPLSSPTPCALGCQSGHMLPHVLKHVRSFHVTGFLYFFFGFCKRIDDRYMIIWWYY